MSDHPNEAKRELKRIVICADICLDVFRWLSPAKVGLSLALVCRRFEVLANAHFWGRRWTLGNLRIIESPNGVEKIVKFATDGPSEVMPIAQLPHPNGVVGFKCIECRFVNAEVVAFLRRIGRLFHSDITLVLGLHFFKYVFIRIWPLLNVAGIVQMMFIGEDAFRRFRSLTTPFVFRDCVNLRQITFLFAFPLQFPPDDSAEASVGQALCKWLHIPRDDGQPKVLRTKAIPMEELKAEFRRASTGLNFIIIFDEFSMVPFVIENSLTWERLAVRKVGNKSWVLVRSPIDKNAAQWDEWEREALAERFNNWKMIAFYDKNDRIS